jgi:hypothetical protein
MVPNQTKTDAKSQSAVNQLHELRQVFDFCPETIQNRTGMIQEGGMN